MLGPGSVLTAGYINAKASVSLSRKWLLSAMSVLLLFISNLNQRPVNYLLGAIAPSVDYGGPVSTAPLWPLYNVTNTKETMPRPLTNLDLVAFSRQDTLVQQLQFL